MKGHTDTLTTWYGKLAELKARGMTDEHPDVKAARDNIATAQRAIVDREAEIAAVVSKRFEERVRFESGKTVEEAKRTGEVAPDGQHGVLGWTQIIGCIGTQLDHDAPP